jgi:ribosomal protein S14
MTTYYQPAAPNYHGASHRSNRERGYRLCDQCGIEESPAVKFRLCGGCVRTRFKSSSSTLT